MEEQTDITTHTDAKDAVRLLRMFIEKKNKNKNSDILDSVFTSVVSI